jgi:para-aminobenzoate synthetase/4-amino-4-deoxychorismate lyase
MAQAYCEIDLPHPSRPGRLAAAFCAPLCVLSARKAEEVPGLLEQAESWSRAGHWVIGFVAYEAASAFDPALRTHPAPPPGMPYALFAVFRDAPAAPRPRKEYLCGAWRDETPRAQFDAALHLIRHGIRAGGFYQVNYTTRLRAPFLGDGLSFFDELRAGQPEAYCTYLEADGLQICSVSPELFFSWPAGHGLRTLTCRPMKGTAARHQDAKQDRAAAQGLKQSAKERAENLMIVDLMRNDLSRVAQPGTVRVPALFSVEAWPTVWQMTSTVTCETQAGTRLRDVFGALFPCGSVTGAPKAASMAAIRTLEAAPRGAYCGAIGALLPGGDALFSVGIRTPVIDASVQRSVCGIGSGIVLDSTPDAEAAEWVAKAAFLMRACPEYELLETLRLHRGRYWLLRGHLQRLERSAHALGFAFDTNVILGTLRAEAARHPDGHWRVRLRLCANGAARTEIQALDPLPVGPRMALASMPIDSADPWLRHKTTRREVYARVSSTGEGIFDTLLYNERGELTEFTRGNLVLECAGRLLTPRVDCGLLPGVFRAALLARGRIQESVLRQEDLQSAERIWFVNSVRGAVPVGMVDGAKGETRTLTPCGAGT